MERRAKRALAHLVAASASPLVLGQRPVVDVGLLRRQGEPMLATSVDGLLRLELREEGGAEQKEAAKWLRSVDAREGGSVLAQVDGCVWAGLEVKAATTDRTEEKALAQFGKGVRYVYVGADGEEELPDVGSLRMRYAAIPRDHRQQLEHHAYTTDLRTFCYARVTADRLVCAMFVIFSGERLARLRAGRVRQLGDVGRLMWEAAPAEMMASAFGRLEAGIGFAPDAHTAVQRLLLSRSLHRYREQEWETYKERLRRWREARREEEQQQQQLEQDGGRRRRKRRRLAQPRYRMLPKIDAKPAAVVAWNHSKHGTDQTSQVIKSVAPRARMSSAAVMQTRAWMYVVKNLWCIANLLRARAWLTANPEATWHQWVAYKSNNAQPFRAFVGDLVAELPHPIECIGDRPGAVAGPAATSRNAPPKFPRRNMAKLWSERDELVAWRTSGHHKVAQFPWATPGKPKKMKLCVVCQGPASYSTAFGCETCGGVTLCVKKRGQKQLSCFDWFHTPGRQDVRREVG